MPDIDIVKTLYGNASDLAGWQVSIVSGPHQELRASQLRGSISAHPKMTKNETVLMATNFDRIINSVKTNISLGELCKKSNIGDGTDPKALYNYRQPHGKSVRPKLVKDATRYLKIIDVLAQMLGRQPAGLVVELCRGTAYATVSGDGREFGVEATAYDLIDALDATLTWIRRTTRIDAAFSAIINNGIDVSRSIGGKVSFLFGNRSHHPHIDGFRMQYIDAGNSLFYPELPVYYSIKTPKICSEPGWVCKVNNTPAKYFEKYMMSLIIVPDANGQPVIAMAEYEDGIIRTDDGIDHLVTWIHRSDVTNKLIANFDINGEAEIEYPPYDNKILDLIESELDDVAVEGAISSLLFDMDELCDLQSNTCCRTLTAITPEKLLFQADLLKELEAEATELTRLWSSVRVTDSNPYLSRLLNGFDPNSILPVPAIDALKKLGPLADRVPPGNWIVSDPHIRTSLPDSLWCLADIFAESAMAAVNVQKHVESRTLQGTIARLRGVAKAGRLTE